MNLDLSLGRLFLLLLLHAPASAGDFSPLDLSDIVMEANAPADPFELSPVSFSEVKLPFSPLPEFTTVTSTNFPEV